MRNLTACNITEVVYKMWGVGHQKISCNYVQNNKCEGGQGEAATSIRFIIVPIEEEENNDYDINP